MMISSHDPSRSHNIFIYDKIKVFFNHTDYYGYVHLYQFLEWMAYAREAFFSSVFPSFFLNEDLNALTMVTVKAEYEHITDAKFGDEVLIVIFTEKVRKTSFDVVFEFSRKDDKVILGYGKQTLVFLGKSSNKPAYIPAALLFEIKNGERHINSVAS